MPYPALLAPTGLADRFALIIDGLCRATAARIAVNRAMGPLIILIWRRLRRMASRFAALNARVRAGTLRAPRHRTTAPRKPRPPDRLPDRLPQHFAWLIRLVPEAAACGGQLQALLSDPEMQTLLAAAPQAGRILRPLCRMLAVQPPPALLPPPPARPAPQAAPPTPKSAKPKAPGRAPPDVPPDPPGMVWRRWRGILMPEFPRPGPPAPPVESLPLPALDDG